MFCPQLSPDWGIDYESYEWRKLDPNSEECKTMVKEYFLWEGEFKNVGKDFNQGKIFKWGAESWKKHPKPMDTHLTVSSTWKKVIWDWVCSQWALNDFVVTCKIKHFPECHLLYFMCGLAVFFSSFEFAHEWFKDKQICSMTVWTSTGNVELSYGTTEGL